MGHKNTQLLSNTLGSVEISMQNYHLELITYGILLHLMQFIFFE